MLCMTQERKWKQTERKVHSKLFPSNFEILSLYKFGMGLLIGLSNFSLPLLIKKKREKERKCKYFQINGL